MTAVELSVAAAHLRQRAETLRLYSNERIAAEDDAVAALLEAIARRGENEILTMAHVRVAAARVAAVVVPTTKEAEDA